ncbi:MAG: hypothetical protein AMJ93_01160 [Anaerolineae bacterium SM23_84]|nr:MAG: hypothetical protein AMJ93_01160 [Anaerolineae bacterium SM23_84]
MSQSTALVGELKQPCTCRKSAKEVWQLMDEAVRLLVFSTYKFIARIDQIANQAGGEVCVD